MKPEHLEALSALFDGERVDPSLLTEALADPEAADALAGFAGLRVLAREHPREPSEAFYRRMDALMNRRGLRDRAARFLLTAAAAALIFASGATGFILRAVLEPSEVIAVDRPPAPFRPAPTVVTWPAPAIGPGVQLLRPTPSEAGAPPTSGLRLRFLRWEDAPMGLAQHPE